uniref:Peptidase A2 domain-containing protein n=1 Tax=Meloidogyne floridensis TaxID=298350 RepID=A0A915NHW5_9BILA
MCTESYFGIYRKEKNWKIYLEKISKNECWETWDKRLLQTMGEKVWQTPRNWEKEYSFFGETCKNVTGLTLEEGTGAILEGRKLVTSWGDEFLVERKDDELEGWTKHLQTEEILIWRIPGWAYWNTHFRVGPVNSEIWAQKTVVVGEMQYSFVYHKNGTHPENVYGLPKKTLRMENDVFVEIIEENGENKTRVRRQGGTGILKKNRRLFEIKTNIPVTTTEKPTEVETTLRATTMRKEFSTEENKRTTPIWKVTPTARITTPRTITRTEIVKTTERTRIQTPIWRVTPTTSKPTQKTIVPSSKIISSTQPSTTKRIITPTRSTTVRIITPKMTTTSPTPRMTSTTKKNFIKSTVRPPLKQKAPPTTKRPQMRDETKIPKVTSPASRKVNVIETTERTTTTLVMKREVSDKPWLDPKDENHANSRLNYLDWKTEQRRVLEAREKWITDCHNRNSQLSIARALAREMPEQAARSLYNRDDITATLLSTEDGKIRWQLNKCRQVKADSIDWTQMIGKDCYKETPVTVNKKRYFLKPGGRDLISEGTKIDCLKKKKPNIDKNANKTKIEELNIISSFQTSPQINRQNPLIFNVGSIFESDQTRLDQNMQDLTKRLNRPELTFPEETDAEFEEENNSTKGTVRAIIAQGNKAFQTVVEQGNVLIGKSSEVLEKGKNFWEDPFGIKSTIKMILAVIAGVALLIGLCVIYWKGRVYIMLVINGIRAGGRMANFMINLLRPRRNRPITVSAVERRLTPTAPLAEEVLEEEAYILNFIPKVYQVTSKKRRCHINVTLNGNKTRALFDTGADITYVSKKVADACRMKINKGDFPQAQAANSTPIFLIGSANTLVEIGNFRTTFPILISENEGCPGGAIIGTDLMEEINKQEDYMIGIDFKRGEVHLGGSSLPMVHAVNSEWKPMAVQLLKTHLLPALSDSLVWGKINKGAGPEEQFITVEREHKYFPIRVGKCLVKPMAKRIVPLRLLNYGNAEITVHANSKLANLEPIGSELKIETVIEGEKAFMTDEEWKEFKERVDQIPEEANWIKRLPDEPISSPEKPIFERIVLDGTILSREGLWKEGDLVLTRREDKGGKFDHKFQGPYKIIKVEKPNLILEDPESGERKIVHMDKCKIYNSERNEEINIPVESSSGTGNPIDTPQINFINFEKFSKSNICRLFKFKNYFIEKMAADMEEAVELLQEEELDANYRWEEADKNWDPLKMTSKERDNFVTRKEKQEDKAMDNYSRAWENHKEDEINKRKIERGQRHALKEMMAAERNAAIKFAKRLTGEAFRSGQSRVEEESKRREREVEAWNRAWGWPPINDKRRDEEKRKRIEEQITQKMFEKYAENNPWGEDSGIMVEPEMKEGNPMFEELVNLAMKNSRTLTELRKDVEEEEWDNLFSKPGGSHWSGGERGYGRGRRPWEPNRERR